MKKRYWALIISITALAGLALRMAYIMLPTSLSGDASVFGLMAKHISEMREFPIYMWLAHYSGTLVSYVSAVFFKIFGVSVPVFLWTSVLLSLIWAFVMIGLARVVLPEEGQLAVFLWSLFPPAAVFFYLMDMSNANSGALLFGTITLWLLMRWFYDDARRGFLMPLSIGFFAGSGMWLSPAMIPAFLTVVSALWVYRKKASLSFKDASFLLAGFVAGYMPAIIYSIQYPGASFLRFGGRVLDLDRSILSVKDPAALIFRQILWRISTIPGSLIKLPVLIVSLTGLFNSILFFVAATGIVSRLVKRAHGGEDKERFKILLIFLAWFILIYITMVGEDKIRFILPLALVIPIFIGKILCDAANRSRRIYPLILAIIIIGNLYGAGSLFANRDRAGFSEVNGWLESKGIKYAFSDYDTAYPLIFESREKVIVSPTLFHPTFADRRPWYTKEVRSSGKFAYILNRARYPDEAVEAPRRLKALGAEFRIKAFEKFFIYYDLSKAVYPEELSLNNSSDRREK